MKRCIIHIPNKLNPAMASASQIRPLKMVNAFKSIGYEVDVIEGYSRERKKKIKQIKKNIVQGTKYDFMYAESSTMPTLLTDKHHIPFHPFLDFGFFKFVRKHGIKIGLFYRDIYWKFPIYQENVKGIKARLAIQMYKYDLYEYSKYLNKLYMPNERCYKYIKKEIPIELFDVLPPGCIQFDKSENKRYDGIITILYVGGLGKQYQITRAVQAISECPKVHFILCCRKKEWDDEKSNFEQYLTENIEVVHESGEELEKLYEKADIGLILFKPDLYIEMAMPYKAFEYMGHGLPMIASKNTAIGDFVVNKNLGWAISYDNDSFKELLLNLSEDKECINKKIKNIKKEAIINRWEDRAMKVETDLK